MNDRTAVPDSAQASHGNDWVKFGMALSGGVLVVGLIVAGWPGSGYSLGAVLGWLLFAAVADDLARRAAAGSPARFGLHKRLVRGAAEAGRDVALWTGLGLGLVWLWQLAASLARGNHVDASRMGRVEFGLADRVTQLQMWGDATHFAIGLGAAFGGALALGALWPHDAAPNARRWAMRGAVVLLAVGCCGAVSVDAAHRYYAPAYADVATR